MTGNTGVMAFAAAGLRTPLGEDFHSVARDAEVAEVEAAAMVQTGNCAPEVFAALVASTWCSLLISLWLEEAVRLGVRLEVAYFTLIAGGDFIQKEARAMYRRALSLARHMQG